MGSVFAGRMILEATLLSLKNRDVTPLWCDVLESKPARLKEKAGGLRGAQPPPICKHNVFMIGSERVHMGSVFAGE